MDVTYGWKLKMKMMVVVEIEVEQTGSARRILH